MIAERDGPMRRATVAAGRGPARPLSVWVDPDGNVYDRSEGEPVPTGRTLDELAATHDGLDRPLAILATGWRLFHARPRTVDPE